MFTVLQLAVNPAQTWERASKRGRGFWSLVGGHLLPLLGIVGLARWYALVHWGRWEPWRQDVRLFAPEQAWLFAGVQVGSSLLAVFCLAGLMRWLARSFNSRATFLTTLTVAAYAYSPFFVIRLLDMIPALPQWLTALLGFGLVSAALYTGLPRMLRLTAANAFGCYCINVVLVGLSIALMRLCSTTVLYGRPVF